MAQTARTPTMDKKTRRALEESILHWRYNLKLAKKGENFGVFHDDCALCVLFYTTIIPAATVRWRGMVGQNLCRGTPYVEVVDAMKDMDIDSIVAAVRAELDFLIAPRPKLAKKKRMHL